MAIHKLRALEYLVAVVEHGGFAAAARRLGVAAPSVHRLVSALEKDMGTQLLDRAGTPMRATPDAMSYVEQARQLLDELRGLDASLHDQASTPTGTVRVAAQSVVLQFVLAELLPRFHVQHPNVCLDLIDVGIERNLLALEAAVGLQQGVLSRFGKQRHSRIRGTGAGQHLSGSTTTVATIACIARKKRANGPPHSITANSRQRKCACRWGSRHRNSAIRAFALTSLLDGSRIRT